MSSMDFFAHQQKARSRTMLLVVLYSIAVAFSVAAIYVVFAVIGAMCDDNLAQQLSQNPINPGLLAVTAFGVLLIVGGGSLFKIAQLSAGGGKAVAEGLGGRLVSPGSRDPYERRLYNVVEEIALAAGVPVPPVYIMDNEPSINAFAAGFTLPDAVVSVNRGTLELLSRDELQGVLGHEFSHVINGDMKINLRLIGVLFGLQLIMLIGYYAMRMSWFTAGGGYQSNSMGFSYNGGYGGAEPYGFRDSDSNSQRSGAGIGMVMMLAGLGIMAVGAIGMFFSSVIKAAVSRQRELLADASAVQFTRNPDGIAGALKKIGCLEVGSNVLNERAAEASHLFFGNVCPAFSLGDLFATHPPLTYRIQQILPSFDGVYPDHVDRVRLTAADEQDEEKREQKQGNQSNPFRKFNPMRGFGGDGSGIGMGGINPASIIMAGGMMNQLPQQVDQDSQNALSAKAVFYAVLLDADPTIRNVQMSIIASKETPFVNDKVQQIYGQVQSLAEELKIPLVQRISASLRRLSPEQYKAFSGIVDALVAADKQMDLFEYTLKAMLLRDQDIFFGLAQPPVAKYSSFSAVQSQFVTVLSYLAQAGHDNPGDAQKAFADALDSLKMDGSMISPDQLSVTQFDQALRTLAQTTPALKKDIYTAFFNCIQSDGQITVREGELIRAIAAMLAIPMPNFQQA